MATRITPTPLILLCLSLILLAATGIELPTETKLCNERHLQWVEARVCPESDPSRACLCPQYRHMERHKAIQNSVEFACCSSRFCSPELISRLICCNCDEESQDYF